MAQALPRYCPRCGTPTRADMQFCATCELPVEAMLRHQGTSTGDYQEAPYQGAFVSSSGQRQQGDETLFEPGLPGAQDFQSGHQQPGSTAYASLPPASGDWNAQNTAYAPDIDEFPTQTPWHNQAPPQQAPWDNQAAWNNQAPPQSPAAQAPWNSPVPQQQTPQPRRQPRVGRIVLVLLLLILVAGGGVFGYLALSGHLNVTQSAITTTRLNDTVTYAGATLTVLTVQQAQNFVDDPQSVSTGMLRLTVSEQNTTGQTITWDYNQSAHLVGAGKSALAPVYITENSSLAPGATRQSILDFAITNGGNLNNLTLRLGTAQEAQIEIPLKGQANLSQYQPQTTTQKGTLAYFGLDWTLTSSTTSLSQPGQQASTGMEFLTLGVSVANTLSQQAISGSAFDYMRVKVNDQTIAPISTTIPVSFAAGETGQKGVATFLIPQNSTNCTLLLLSQDPGKSGQATVDFKVG